MNKDSYIKKRALENDMRKKSNIRLDIAKEISSFKEDLNKEINQNVFNYKTQNK